MREEEDRPIESNDKPNDKEPNNPTKAECNQETPKEAVDFGANFIRDLQEFEANDFKFDDRNKLFEIGRPSEILIEAGIIDLPIIMTQATLNKAFGRVKDKNDANHELIASNLTGLHASIHNPVMVIDSITYANAKVIISDIRDKKGETAIIAIHPNKAIGRRKVNVIASIHTRSNKKTGDLAVIAEIKGEIWYIDPEKIKSWLKQVGQLQLLPKLLSQL